MKKQTIIDILSQLHAKLLFQTLVPLHGSKQECYGTETDVYLDAITVDLDIDESVINLTFQTNDYPCIAFCMKLANRYNLNVQLLYFNRLQDYSGKFSIHWHQVVINVRHSYWYGLYKYQEDVFWETISESFESGISFHWFIGSTGLGEMKYDDMVRLRKKYEDESLAMMFQRL